MRGLSERLRVDLANHRRDRADHRGDRALPRIAGTVGGDRRRAIGRPGITRRAALAGGIAAMSVLTDYPDYSGHVAHADQIAATGVPLLTKSTLLYRQAIVNLGAGQSASTGVLPVSQIGYEVLVSAQTGAASANPFARVALQWTDSTTEFIVATDTFVMPMATDAGGFTVIGRGPTKADELNITVTNFDTTTAPVIALTALANSRVYPADQWRWAGTADAGRTVPGYALAALNPDETVLGFVGGISLGAGAAGTWLFGMSPGGPVQLSYNFAGVTPANIRVHVFPLPTGLYSGQNDLAGDTVANLSDSLTFRATRSPLAVEIGNTATAGTLTGSMAMVGTLC